MILVLEIYFNCSDIALEKFYTIFSYFSITVPISIIFIFFLLFIIKFAFFL